MNKRIIILFLALTVLLGALTLTVSAAESGTCGANLTWTLDSEGTLTISGIGAMSGYSLNNKAPWYSQQDSILSVVVEDGVTSIGAYAFQGCTSLTSITLPDSVTRIDYFAFQGCTCLTSITLPDSLTSIDYSAFQRCTCLNSITIPEGVTSISYDAFSNCESLDGIWVEDGNPNYSSDDRGVLFNKAKTELIQAPSKISGAYSVPESVTSIGKSAFEDCASLSSITIPEGVTSIGNYAFDECVSLSSITLPDSLTSIGDCAFQGCTCLNSITIPEGVTSIGRAPFVCCYSLDSIWVAGGNTNYSSDDYGVLFDKNKTQLIQAPAEISGSYSIPDSVTSIGEAAFAYCDISSITIPEGVTSIGNSAFHWCDSLSSITLPDSLTSIGNAVFSSCENLSSITIPAGISSIGYYAFDDCIKLHTVHYAGTEAQKADISIGGNNEYLTDATWHYECDGTDIAPPETPPMENPFVDVPEDAYYAEPVLWAVEKGVTNGLSADTFGPDATCTRAQIVTFLWRANGSPAPTSNNNPFTDIPAGQWYTDAVLWAVEKGITAGTSATTFSPDAGCTRGQVATFLWRAEGESATNGSNIFADIAPGAYYYDAVLWAVENSITNGMGDGTFAPDATCTRGQIVTFLYRAVA